MNTESIILAVPGGRILAAFRPLLTLIGIEPESDFGDPQSRKLVFSTNDPKLTLIQVRSFDVATFVAFGAAQLGIAGNDVINEFGYSEIYTPVNLHIARCRLSVAAPTEIAKKDTPSKWSTIRIATKYPNTVIRHFAQRGIHAECIRLNGTMEHAPGLGLCPRIVDLVQTGSTLRTHGLVEIETILHVTSRLIINRTSFKTQSHTIKTWIQRFQQATHTLLSTTPSLNHTHIKPHIP